MKTLLLAGAALAVLGAVPSPASAATPPHVPAVSLGASSAPAKARPSRALWLHGTRATAAAQSLIDVLRRAQLDGMASGPAVAAQAQALLQRAAAGDAAAASQADRLLSEAWVRYVQTIRRPTTGMDYADHWAAPRQSTPAQILAEAAAAPSLAEHVARVAAVNPVYSQLRDSAWSDMQMTGRLPDQSALDTLAKARNAPAQRRYIIVDAHSANLWMIENGRIVGSMPVITGADENETPMIASTIYYATLNPYWNVPADLVQSLIAPRVVEQGIGYLTERNYEVLASYDKNAEVIDPASVDWKAVAAGHAVVKLRRQPGQWNSMGKMKFGFANDSDIFLHDTPYKELFEQDDRKLSHGCIRLSDAKRLATWMLGRDPSLSGDEPEQHVALPTPVPIYVTHLDAEVSGGRIALAKRSSSAVQVAGLR